MNHTVFITGASGYVGAMLVDTYIKRPDVDRVIALDMETIPDFLKESPFFSKITFIRANTSDDTWQEEVSALKPDIIIHTAWQIRELYGKKDLQHLWNIVGSDAIFDFALSFPFVKHLVHFSTVASYGAYSDNEIEHVFKEENGFRPTDYLYAEEKRIAEAHLEEKYAKAKEQAQKSGIELPAVTIIRPASITGPRGRFMKVRFGLQSVLSGKMRQSSSLWYRAAGFLTSITPITKKWCRQFVHEDDIAGIVTEAAFGEKRYPYEAFNAAPPGAVVRGEDMARVVGKKPIVIPPFLIRFVFFVLWHISRGSIPTSRGGWKTYSYPIVVDGSKSERVLGYTYKYSSIEAISTKEGVYGEYAR